LDAILIPAKHGFAAFLETLIVLQTAVCLKSVFLILPRVPFSAFDGFIEAPSRQISGVCWFHCSCWFLPVRFSN